MTRRRRHDRCRARRRCVRGRRRRRRWRSRSRRRRAERRAASRERSCALTLDSAAHGTATPAPADHVTCGLASRRRRRRSSRAASPTRSSTESIRRSYVDASKPRRSGAWTAYRPASAPTSASKWSVSPWIGTTSTSPPVRQRYAMERLAGCDGPRARPRGLAVAVIAGVRAPVLAPGNKPPSVSDGKA